jgi:hypothetical protein
MEFESSEEEGVDEGEDEEFGEDVDEAAEVVIEDGRDCRSSGKEKNKGKRDPKVELVRISWERWSPKPPKRGGPWNKDTYTQRVYGVVIRVNGKTKVNPVVAEDLSEEKSIEILDIEAKIGLADQNPDYTDLIREWRQLPGHEQARPRPNPPKAKRKSAQPKGRAARDSLNAPSQQST